MFKIKNYFQIDYDFEQLYPDVFEKLEFDSFHKLAMYFVHVKNMPEFTSLLENADSQNIEGKCLIQN